MNSEIILHLSLIPGIGARTIKFLAKFDIWDKLNGFAKIDFLKLGLSERFANLIFNGLKDKQLLIDEKNFLREEGSEYVSLADKYYPTLLKEIDHSPAVLYYKSENKIDFDRFNTMAVVASRAATSYTKDCCRIFFRDLCFDEDVIVSGGAIGGDTMIHEEALACNIKTWAIIGSGLSHLYPQQNISLFKKILDKGGAIISPFSMHAAARPGNFPARNCIIAGLSHTTTVIQADRDSGALITAHYALEYGRDIAAVPGFINSHLSRGCHYLIQNGACLITSNKDFSDFVKSRKNIGTCTQTLSRNESEELSSIKELSLSDKILALCQVPLAADVIASQVGISLMETKRELFNLMLDQKLEQDILGRWQRK